VGDEGDIGIRTVTVFDLGLKNCGARCERRLRSHNRGGVFKGLYLILTDKVGIVTQQLGKLLPGALRRTAKAVDEENEFFLHDTLVSGLGAAVYFGLNSANYTFSSATQPMQSSEVGRFEVLPLAHAKASATAYSRNLAD
jgi:hypothetical protein